MIEEQHPIHELHKARELLEQSLYNLLSQFELDTLCSVADIHILRKNNQQLRTPIRDIQCDIRI